MKSVLTFTHFRTIRLVAVFAASCAMAEAQSLDSPSEIFQGTNLLRIFLEIPEAGLRTLRESHEGQNQHGKPQAQARLTEGGHVYSHVAVQLKGFSSFQPIDETPSLTLHFDKFAPKQKFHGLSKLSLNNSYQDPTRLHERFARELFAAAGVPVPRADHALVTLNGRELGLYVLTEGFNKEFLKRHFDRTDGTLYEGGILRDIDQPLQQIGSTTKPGNRAAIQRLISAAREPDPDKRWRALNAALDMERFLSMVAMETMICHSDSYSMNRNNYRLYCDPASDRVVFLPHGMDRVLGTHRSPLDLPAVPPALGLVAKAVLSIPEGRRQYVERFGVLFTNLFDPVRLCQRVQEINAKIIGAKASRPVDQRFDGRPAWSAAQDAADLCSRISERAAELNFQLAHRSELLSPAPMPAFNANRMASLDQWKPKRRPAHRGSSSELEIQYEDRILHLRASKAPLIATLRNRVSLPVGSYRIVGQIKVMSTTGTNSLAATVVRYSAGRFAVERKRLEGKGRGIDFGFQVSSAMAPEEIEFICEVRDDASDVRFDASSLRLIQIER